MEDESTDAIFVDKDIFRISFLKRANPEAYDFKTIAKRFIYYCSDADLLSNNSSDFIRCWCLLILDMPNIYEGTGDNFFKLPSEDTISTVPLIDMEGNDPEFDKISFSDHTTKLTTGGMGESTSITINTKNLLDQINVDADILNNRVLMGIICINMMRMMNKSQESVMKHVNAKLYHSLERFTSLPHKEKRGLYFDPKVYEIIREKFRADHDSYRRILIQILYTYDTAPYADEKSFLFYSYAIKTPLAYNGLHLWELSQEAICYKGERWGRLQKFIKDTGDPKLIDSVKKLTHLRTVHGAIAVGHEILKAYPRLQNATIKFFPYCRAIDLKYHSSLSIAKHKELACVLAGMSPSGDANPEKIWALSKFHRREHYVSIGNKYIMNCETP